MQYDRMLFFFTGVCDKVSYLKRSEPLHEQEDIITRTPVCCFVYLRGCVELYNRERRPPVGK